MTRLGNLRIVDPVLTNLVRGYTNAALVGDKLFPVVGVPKEAGTIPSFGKEAFKVYKTKRALRAGSNVLLPEGITTDTLQTEEHDIAYPIDYRETAEANAALNYEQHAAIVVKDVIDIGREKEIADLAQATASYPTGNKITLTSTGQWSDSANSLPIDNIKAGMAAIRKSIGRFPNVLLLSFDSYDALTKSAQILGRIKYSQKGIITTDIIKAILAVPDNTPLEVVIGLPIYSTDAGVFTDIWSKTAILAYVAPKRANMAASQYDLSFAYTFRRNKYPFVDKYTSDGGKVNYVRNTDNYDVKIVGSGAGYLISATV